jgi:hypothetical protein
MHYVHDFLFLSQPANFIALSLRTAKRRNTAGKTVIEQKYIR